MNLSVSLEDDPAFRPPATSTPERNFSLDSSQQDLFSTDISPTGATAHILNQNSARNPSADPRDVITIKVDNLQSKGKSPKYPPDAKDESKPGISKKGKSIVRCRNYSQEEIEIILREAGKHAKLLKGRFQPSVTNENKKKVWIQITDLVNKVNLVGDRDWQAIRKKWQDLTSTARKKYRTIVKEQHKTGGGLPSVSDMSAHESMAMESISEVSVRGITSGIDCTQMSLSASANLMSQSAKLVNQSDDSEISFNPPRANFPEDEEGEPSSRYIPEPDINEEEVATDSQPHSHHSAPSSISSESASAPPELKQAPEKTLPPIKSNRTVTRDLRRTEFKTLLQEKKKTNDLLQEIIRLKNIKYQFLGILPHPNMSD